jgi:hypothetical protein
MVVRAARIPRRPVQYASQKLDGRGLWRNILSIHLEREALLNAQQLEVAVNGPDGATHLILCTGVADLGYAGHEIYTFFVGPQISRRQFVGAMASWALARIQTYNNSPTGGQADAELGANLVSIDADYDDESGQVKVSAEVSSSVVMTKLAISYNVSILAELPMY